MPVLGWTKQKVMPVWAGDVGEAVTRAFEQPHAWNRTLEIGGPEALTMRDAVATLVRHLGKRRLLVPMPTALAKIATTPLTLLPYPPLTPRGVDFATGDAIVDDRELRATLSISPVPLAEGLTRYAVG